MYQEERLVKILEHLKSNDKASNDEISKLLNISRDTVRRDFIKLVEEGAAIRTHGGIALPHFKEAIKAYKERLNTASKQKFMVGRAASKYIANGDLCFIDVSTTNKFLCEQIKKNITVYTHSLDNAVVLSTQKEIEVHLLGGKFNHENRFFYDLALASRLNDIYFDKAFFGAAAILEDGIYFANPEDAYMKQMVAKRAEQVFLLTDSHKFNLVSSYKGLSFQDIHTLITNEAPPDKYMRILKAHRIKIEIAHEEGDERS
ncbi:transcriptional regulator [Paenibacillus jilunlii]|uniref:Transcriptional regulator n=1 Tax=Paenibacillus jilunlii TaxID=682956 RepID=A0ABR5SP66_9BACL|nr:transcriptional regulator [Paenibacillus jilunlii]